MYAQQHANNTITTSTATATSSDNVFLYDDIASSTTPEVSSSAGDMVPSTIDFNDPKILAALAAMRAILKDPEVKLIRKVFNEYLNDFNKNTNNDLALDTWAFGIDDLNSFDKSLYRSRFVVDSWGPSVAGGEEYNIIFLDYPEQVYYVWIYNTSKPHFREFFVADSYPSNYGVDLLRLNPRLVTDPTLSI